MARTPAGTGDGDLVAVVLTWRSRVGLFKRSTNAESEQGLWHCVTAALDDSTPIERALTELHVGTGLRLVDLVHFGIGPVLTVADGTAADRRVHTFVAATEKRVLTLGAQHETYRWVPAARLARFDGQVGWVQRAVTAVVTSSDN